MSGIRDEEWIKTNSKAFSRICLFLAIFVFLNVVEENTMECVGEKIANMYETKLATNKFFL